MDIFISEYRIVSFAIIAVFAMIIGLLLAVLLYDGQDSREPEE